MEFCPGFTMYRVTMYRVGSTRPFSLFVLFFLSALAIAAGCESSPETKKTEQETRRKAEDDPEGSWEAADHEIDLQLLSAEIREAGESVVPMEGGRVGVKSKKGGRDGLEIVPLREAMAERIEAIRELGARPELVIRSRPAIPYRTLMEVVYTGSETAISDVPRGQPSFKLAITGPDSGGGKPDFITYGIPKLEITAADYRKPPGNRRPLDLTVAIGTDGIRVAAEGRIIAPKEGCPSDGPTLCLTDDSIDIQEQVDRAVKAYAGGDASTGRTALDEAMGAYDFDRLDDVLAAIKKERPEATDVTLSLDPDLPVLFLDELTRRTGEHFPDPTIAIAK